MRRVVVACVLALVSSASWAQTYPSRVIRYVVSDSPGSGLDTLARIVTDDVREW